MPGSFNWFDAVDITASSEYSSRLGAQVRYLQIHHATMTSLSGLISMMDPGGRTVSANGALGNDGRLVEVVPATSRAFTSGVASFDRQCITVETCNTSLHPTWGISAASRERLAQLAVAMYRQGWLGGLTRQFIIGHNEVPGTYATACPGPDMNLDWIVARARQIHGAGGGTAGGGGTVPINQEEDMAFMVKREDNGKTFLHDGDIITHIVHDDVVRVLNYVGIKGGLGTNLISHDDHRRIVEAHGFPFGTVNALPPGQGIQRFTERLFPAGNVPW